MSKAPGFTLIELMVTLGVLAIAVAIAAPSYVTLITNNRMAGEINDFVANLHFARSEAIKRGIPVRLCRSNDDPPTCNAPTGGWEQGWIVVVMNGAGGTAGTLLKDRAAFSGSDRFTGSESIADALQFDRNGFALGGNNGTFVLCDSARDVNKARAVIVSNTGRIRLAEDGSDRGGVVESPPGTNVTCP